MPTEYASAMCGNDNFGIKSRSLFRKCLRDHLKTSGAYAREYNVAVLPRVCRFSARVPCTGVK